jgi:multidrug efflux system membrane fusion protein
MASAAVAALLATTPVDAAVAQDAQEHSAVPVSVATVEPHEADTWDEFSGRLEAVEREVWARFWPC